MLSAAIVAVDDVRSIAPTAQARTPAGDDRTSLAIIVRRGDEPVALARLQWRAVRIAGWQAARLALVDRVQLVPGSADSSIGLDPIYRVILDLLEYGSERADLVRFVVPAEAQPDVDLLWRFAVALDGECAVRGSGSRFFVDVRFPGLRGQLGWLVSTLHGARTFGRIRSRIRSVIARRGRAASSERSGLFALDLSTEPRDVRASDTISFEEVPPEELARRPGAYGQTLTGVTSGAPLRCYAGIIGDRVVFRMQAVDVVGGPWAGAHGEAVARLPTPAALLTGAYTAPEHRGRSIYPAALIWIAQQHRRTGYRSLCLTVSLSNRPALRAAQKAGFRRVD